jgi:hypothetical protein
MEVYYLDQDLKIFCVRAESFPNDIGKAFSKLIELLPTLEGRTFLGISYQANDHMIYQAAVLETYEGEGLNYGCDQLVIEKGKYLAETLKGWKKKEGSIGATFRKLTDSPHDTTFPCVEWYFGEDVMCMVKLYE